MKIHDFRHSLIMYQINHELDISTTHQKLKSWDPAYSVTTEFTDSETECIKVTTNAADPLPFTTFVSLR